MCFFFRRSRAAYSALSGQIGPNLALLRDFIVVLYEEDPTKYEGTRVLTIFSPIKTLWELFVVMETSSDPI